MATTPWAIPTGKAITGTTFIKDTDNNIAATIEDLVDWCNNASGTYNDYTLTGLRTDFLSVSTAQAITSVKTIDTGGAIDFTNGQLRIGGVAVTSTAAELNTLDGITATVSELNILDGVTATAAEINVLDGISPTLTAVELSVLDGISPTLTSIELNVLDGISPTLTAAELSILDGVTATAAEINILDGVTATTSELNILDGVTATATELNYVSGVTSSIQSQFDAINTADSTIIKTALNAGGAAPIYATRAWVNFNGLTVTAAADMTGVRASGNISSVVDNGSGNYTVNFTTAMEDANFAAVATVGETTAGFAETLNQTTSSVRIISRLINTGGTQVDQANVSLVILR